MRTRSDVKENNANEKRYQATNEYEQPSLTQELKDQAYTGPLCAKEQGNSNSAHPCFCHDMRRLKRKHGGFGCHPPSQFYCELYAVFVSILLSCTWVIARSPTTFHLNHLLRPDWPVAFVPSISTVHSPCKRHSPGRRPQPRTLSRTSADTESDPQAKTPSDNETVIGVVAPLSYRGPYPCLSLIFPDIKKPSTMVAKLPEAPDNKIQLDFLLDTGANVNTLQNDFVEGFRLPVTISSEDLQTKYGVKGQAGVGTGSGIFDKKSETESTASDLFKAMRSPGALHDLGRCQLAGISPPPSKSGEKPPSFLRHLLVTPLPMASPVGHGLLGLTFMASFAAVEFDWAGTDGDPPTLQFVYYLVDPVSNTKSSLVPKEILCEQDKSLFLKTFSKEKGEYNFTTPLKPLVPIPLDFSILGVPVVKVHVNGKEISAILDTGAPMSILSTKAAEAIGIGTTAMDWEERSNRKGHKNLRLTETLHQKFGDPVLLVGGVDGAPLQLHRSRSESVRVEVLGKTNHKHEMASIPLGSGPIYVGDVPLLQSLDRFRNLQSDMSNEGNDGMESDVPYMILGLDVLKRSYRMILQVQEKLVWFDPFPDGAL